MLSLAVRPADVIRHDGQVLSSLVVLEPYFHPNVQTSPTEAKAAHVNTCHNLLTCLCCCRSRIAVDIKSGDRVRNIVRNSEMHEWRWVQGNGGEYQFNYKTKRQIFRVEGAPVMMIYWAHRRLTALSQIIIYRIMPQLKRQFKIRGQCTTLSVLSVCVPVCVLHGLHCGTLHLPMS